MSGGNAAREARNQYQRDWYRKNREKVKKYQADYWARVAERAAQSGAGTQVEK